ATVVLPAVALQCNGRTPAGGGGFVARLTCRGGSPASESAVGRDSVPPRAGGYPHPPKGTDCLLCSVSHGAQPIGQVPVDGGHHLGRGVSHQLGDLRDPHSVHQSFCGEGVAIAVRDDSGHVRKSLPESAEPAADAVSIERLVTSRTAEQRTF